MDYITIVIAVTALIVGFSIGYVFHKTLYNIIGKRIDYVDNTYSRKDFKK